MYVQSSRMFFCVIKERVISERYDTLKEVSRVEGMQAGVEELRRREARVITAGNGSQWKEAGIEYPLSPPLIMSAQIFKIKGCIRNETYFYSTNVNI